MLARDHRDAVQVRDDARALLPSLPLCLSPLLGLVVGSYQGCSEALHGLAREAAKAKATAICGGRWGYVRTERACTGGAGDLSTRTTCTGALPLG
jgi:hypothetical protein